MSSLILIVAHDVFLIKNLQPEYKLNYGAIKFIGRDPV